jgi:hypothetical protein
MTFAKPPAPGRPTKKVGRDRRSAPTSRRTACEAKKPIRQRAFSPEIPAPWRKWQNASVDRLRRRAQARHPGQKRAPVQSAADELGAGVFRRLGQAARRAPHPGGVRQAGTHLERTGREARGKLISTRLTTSRLFE